MSSSASATTGQSRGTHRPERARGVQNAPWKCRGIGHRSWLAIVRLIRCASCVSGTHDPATLRSMSAMIAPRVLSRILSDKGAALCPP